MRNVLTLHKLSQKDIAVYINTRKEPTIEYVNLLYNRLKKIFDIVPCAIVSIGGGTTLDIGKALSILFTNKGNFTLVRCLQLAV